MFGRRVCESCPKQATLEIKGRFYCSQHALEVVRSTDPIPPVKMIQR